MEGLHNQSNNTVSDISQNDELLLSELQQIKKQLTQNSITQELQNKQWGAKEETYKEIIKKLKENEVDEWDGIYKTLLSKVENLKEDIDNIKV